MGRQKGYKCSPETRAKMREAHLRVSEKNLAMYGYKVSPETRAKMRASRLKYLAEHPEVRAKMGVQIREGWARRKARLALEQPPQPTTL